MAEHSASDSAARTVREIRVARGLSLRGFAARLGLSPATVSAVERGLVPLTLPRLQQMAEALEVPVSDVIEGVAPPAPEAGPRTITPVPRAIPLPEAADAVAAGAAADAAGDWRDFDALALDPVLAGAARLFVAQGFHATSMREVAAESAMSVAGVYHHYPTKESILVALLDLTMAELNWRLAAARAEGSDAREAFGLMVESLALFHAERGDLAFLGASEMRAFGPEERARVTALRDALQHALDHQALQVRGAGADPDEVRLAARAIATMCTALPTWFRAGGSLSSADVAARYAALGLTMLEQPQGG